MIYTAAEEEARVTHSSSESSSSHSDLSEDFSDWTTSSSDSSDSSSSSIEDLELLPACIIAALEELYHQRYLDRRSIPKTPDNLNMLLNEYKDRFPDIFRSYTGLTPACFDTLVSVLQDHPIFYNNSTFEQMPVVQQVAIALYQFRHYGNAASTIKVALWAGVSYGTV
ncbi:hypothetical protein BDQ17DRAFT_1432470 [Cyathus striatus]|nr:hypothetical protein BDQ17DRAFT_1432470 [Cyathus striatus]